MPDFNDVVRHIILKIVVDSAGLAEELAKARALLKAQEQAEKDSNKARAKDAEQVTKAFEKQTGAVLDNIEAHKRASQESDKNAARTSENIKRATKDVTDSTKAQTEQIRALSGERDKENARQIARDNAALKRSTDREKSISESNARISRAQQKLNQDLADTQSVLDSTRRTRVDTTTHTAQESARRATSVADTAGFGADRAQAEALNAADQRSYDTMRRRRGLINDEARARAEINKISNEGAILEQRALDILERRARAEEKSATTRRRGLSGVLSAGASTLADVIVGAGRSVVSAPRAARQAGRDFDASSLSGVAKDATEAETRVARLLTVVGKLGRNPIGSGLLNAIHNIGAGAESSEHKVSGFFSRIGRDAEGNLKNLSSFSSRFSALFRDIPQAVGGLGSVFRDATRASTGFFGKLGGDVDENVGKIRRLRSQVTGFFQDVNRARQGGNGSTLLGSIGNNLLSGFTALDGAFSGISKHLLSFQNLIVLAVAAFGPLAAILGAAGAAALAAASDFAALAGGLFALPGLLTAAIGGFGLLAAVISPLSKVFSAYTAAQEAAAKSTVAGSTAALTAAQKLQDAQRRLSDADLAYTRAIQDKPRAEQKLAEARRQAKRDIEDLSAAYRKLKFDEEGAQLDVDSAKQSYRRALVDPTANALDRKIARHNLEGAQFAQADQARDAQRTREDFATAMSKGVEGMDAVVEAMRGLQDAQRAITNTLTDRARAQQDLTQAEKESKAGGAAALAAQQALEAELGKLGPKTREVAEALFKLGDSYKAMRNRLSDKIFGQVTGDTGKFKTVLEELETFLGPVADAFGSLAHQAITLFTNPYWNRFFAQQGEANGRIIQGLGEAALSAADGFRSIIEVARPFTDFVVGGIKGMADAFKDFATGDEGRAKIAAFLDLTKQRIQELWPVVKNLAAGFAGFFTALNKSTGGQDDFTTWFNKGLLTASETFRQLSVQAKNPNGGFQKFLRDVRPLLHDMVGLLVQAAKFFGQLFSDPANIQEARDILKAIATQWLPKLAEIFRDLSKSGLISEIATSIGGILSSINKFAEAGGLHGLTVFADALGKIGGSVNFLITALKHIPGLITAMATVSALVLGGALLAKFSGVLLVLRAITAAVRGIKNIFGSIQASPNGPDAATPGAPGTGAGTGKQTRKQRRQARREARQNAGIPVVGRDPTANSPGSTRNTTTGGSRWRRFGRGARGVGKSVFSAETGNNVRNTAGSLFNNVRENTAAVVSGDRKIEPTVGRIEQELVAANKWLKIIAECACGGGKGRPGSTGPSGGGGGGNTGGGGSGGDTGRRPTTTITDDEPTRRPTTAAEREAARQSQRYVGGPQGSIFTRPTSSSRRRFTTRRNVGISSAGQSIRDAIDPARTARYSESLGETPAATATRPARYTTPDTRDGTGALTESEQSRQNRRRGIGLSDSRSTGYFPGAITGTSIPASASGSAPILPTRPHLGDTGRDLTPYVGLDSPQTVPTAATVAKAPQTRNARGQFQSNRWVVPNPQTYDRYTPINIGSIPADPEKFGRNDLGQFVSTKTPNRPALADTSGMPGGVGRNYTVPERTSRPRRISVPNEQAYTGFAPIDPQRSLRRGYGSPQPVLGDVTGTEAVGQAARRSTSRQGWSFQPPIEDGARPTVNPPTADDFRRTRTTTVAQPAIEGHVVPAVRPATETARRTNSTQVIDGEFTETPAVRRGARRDMDVLGDIFNDQDDQRPARSSGPGRLRRGLRSTGSNLKNFGQWFAKPFLEDAGYIEVNTPGRKSKGRRRATTSQRAPKDLSSLFGGSTGGSWDLDDYHADGSRRATSTAVAGGGEYDEGYSDGYRAGSGGGQQGDLPDVDRDSDGKPKTTRKEKRAARKQRRADARRVRRGLPVLGNEADVIGDVVEGELVDDTPSSRARRGMPAEEHVPGSRPAAKGTQALAREGGNLARAGRLGGRLGGLGRAAGGLARGAAGGLGGIAASLALQVGGQAAIDHFVKNDEDANSISRGLGAVSTGAGIGSLVGSVIPGVGTVIGGAVGGAIGGAYSLVKDKNLRNFVGGKLAGAGKAVGGFVSGVGDKIGDAVGSAGQAIGGFFSHPGKALGSLFGGGDGKAGLGGVLTAATGPIGMLLGKTDIGKSIIDSLDKAGSKIAGFFTKSIPDWFHKGIKGITDFFTKTLPNLPNMLVHALGFAVGRILRFFIKDLPQAVGTFFTSTLPHLAVKGWELLRANLLDPFADFIHAIPGFFTKTIPHWFESAFAWYQKHVSVPLANFILHTIPDFFTKTIPRWFAEAPGWFKKHVIDNVTQFFTVTLPNFFTVTLPNAIRQLPGFLYDHLVQPILDFFSGIAGHIGDFLKGSWNWAKGLFASASSGVKEGYDSDPKHMSGGLIQGVFQGIEDTTRIRATPGEFVMRKRMVDEPGAKAVLTDWNEGRIKVSDLLGGLSASTAPPVMSIVPPSANGVTGRVPTVVNNTVNHAPLMGDVIIHNPVREKSDTSLRRQVQIAANRHRR